MVIREIINTFYIWEHTREINEKYNCIILTYEPVNEYFSELKTRTSKFGKIKSYNYGLGKENKKVGVMLRGVQTTTLKQNGK